MNLQVATPIRVQTAVTKMTRMTIFHFVGILDQPVFTDSTIKKKSNETFLP
jgi:hypothetical protein